jgi:MoaA/NifB/PqqE/SkfB family radical SAM enzyme
MKLIGSNINMLSINCLNTCNIHCRFCSEEASVSNNIDTSKYLSKQKIFEIIDECTVCGIEWIVFVGGEPTLRNDLPEIIFYAYKKGIKSGIITNGIRVGEDSDYLKELKKSGLYVVTFSFYGLNDPDTWKITGVKDFFSRNLRGVNNCKKLELRLAFNIVLNKYLIDPLNDLSLWHFFEPYKPSYVFISSIIPKGRAGLIDKLDDVFNIKPDQYVKIFNKIKYLKTSGYLSYIIRMSQFYCKNSRDDGNNLESIEDISCRLRCGIKPEVKWDGQVSACCYYPYSSELVLGNIFEEKLSEIIYGSSSRLNHVLDKLSNTCPEYPQTRDGYLLGCPYLSTIDEL